MKKGNDNFAKNLRILRNTLGLDQAKVAELVGVNSRTYQKYEYGQTTPSEEKKKKLADLFGVEVADLYRDELRKEPEFSKDPSTAILERLDAIESKIVQNQPQQPPQATPVMTDEEREELTVLRRFFEDIAMKAGTDVIEKLLKLDRPTVVGLRLGLDLPDLYGEDSREPPSFESLKRFARAPAKTRSGT